ncbi:MAG: hypothetical protein ACRENT_06435 [Thermodesulfobacteriota bacterium]
MFSWWRGIPQFCFDRYIAQFAGDKIRRSYELCYEAVKEAVIDFVRDTACSILPRSMTAMTSPPPVL